MGDSQTGPVNGVAYASALHTRLCKIAYPHTWVGADSLINLGGECAAAGLRVDQIQTRFEAQVGAYPSDVVLLLAGANNAQQGYQPSNFQSQYTALLQSIQTNLPGAITYAQTCMVTAGPSANTYILTVANPGILAAVAAQQGLGQKVSLVDLYSAISLSDLVDGLHQNPIGMEIQGRLLFLNMTGFARTMHAGAWPITDIGRGRL